jgi:dissimilatory sulfite reductase (desulfoviridin) alpha/beta subunit
VLASFGARIGLGHHFYGDNKMSITSKQFDMVFKDPESKAAYTNAFLEENGELPVSGLELAIWAVKTYPEEF